jgi:hypothetical protein
MSCPYFREGYIGVCIAIKEMHVPSIESLETYCFSEHYRLCPNLVSCMPETFEAKDFRDLWANLR